MDKLKVVKFGGSSLADERGFRRAAEIVLSDEGRRFVVVSALGVGHNAKTKITDDLITAYGELSGGESKTLDKVLMRFAFLARELGVAFADELIKTRKEILKHRRDKAFIISRGEYLTAKLMAKFLGFEFLDAKDFISVRNGELQVKKTRENFLSLDKNARYVIGGFYGSYDVFKKCKCGATLRKTQKISLLSRGGGDITGAIASISLRASVYENYTDVYGVQNSDPRKRPDAQTYASLSRAELFKILESGAQVIHIDCLKILAESGIKLVIDNTFDPHKKNTEVLF
ncbi:MAG: hypothetical protein LBM01_01015 [Christensenellaceae bacterium]|jgi:aspartate kinase|nr:hypothetical protein [Christensenellaceae bacterium]